MNQSPNLNRSWEESQQIIKNLEAEITQLKTQQEARECRCHIIDPSKMRILLWINRHKNGKPDTCVLKIAEQRLLGLPRSDRRGETYWRFDELLDKKEQEPQVSFKCDKCKAEVVVLGSDDYNEEIKQRAKLKQELAQMESVENKPSKAPEQPQEAKTEPKVEKQKSEEKNPARQALKEQIAQAIKESQQAEQIKANTTKQTNETNSNN